MPNVVTIREAVQRAKVDGLPVSEYTIRRWVKSGVVPVRNVGSKALLFYPNILMWQKSFIASKVRKASIPRLSRDVIENLTIPVPPVEIQSEIVHVLDHYEEITIRLRKELEAELIARQKQYEYYRDTLLTFDNVRGGGTHEVVWHPLGDYFCNIRNGFVGTATPYFTTSDEGVRYLKGTNIHNGIRDREQISESSSDGSQGRHQ